ncbi:MAG: winged helix-turn-helix domain-containing protein [Caldilineales bacterium]
MHTDPRFFRELKPLIVAQDATGAYLASLAEIRPQIEAQFPDLIVLEHQCLVAGTEALAGAFRRSQRLPMVFLTTADSDRIRSGEDAIRLTGLIAYLRSQTDQRRAQQITQVGRMRIHSGRMRVALDDRWVRLPPIQFRILHHLALSPGTAIQHRELIDVAWGPEAADDDDRRGFLKVHIMQLRRTLGPEFKDYIQTVRGQGYALVDPNSDE